MADTTPLPLESAAQQLGCTPKTIRYQLARAAEAGQPFARKYGSCWLLYTSDLPALRTWIEGQRAKAVFQPGNTEWRKAKNPGRPKKSGNRNTRCNTDLRRSAKKN